MIRDWCALRHNAGRERSSVDTQLIEDVHRVLRDVHGVVITRAVHPIQREGACAHLTSVVGIIDLRLDNMTSVVDERLGRAH